MNRIRINVSGEVFETDLDLMHEKQFYKLAELHKEREQYGNTSELIVNRPPGTFGAILTYFLTDELHLPSSVCPSVFKRELDFWEVESTNLRECCQYRLQTFTDEESVRKEFITQSTRQSSDSVYVLPPGAGKILRMRARLWDLIDNNENSILAKLYFGLVFVMILLSIVGLALSTEPNFRRSLSSCELLDYLDQIDYDEFEAVDYAMGNPDCSNGIFSHPKDDHHHGNEDWYEKLQNNNGGKNQPSNQPPPPQAAQSSAATDNLKTTTNKEEGLTSTTTRAPSQKNNGGKSDGKNKPRTTQASESSAVTNNLTTTTNTEEGLTSTTTQAPSENNFSDLQGKMDTLNIPISALVSLDFLVNAFFSLDMLLRLVSCPSWKQYFSSSLNLLDALALLSSYLYLIITSVERRLKYVSSKWLYILEFMQVFRALRLFRVVKNVRSSKVLAYSLMQNVKDMSLLVMLLIVGISTFACIIFTVEDRDTIRSIPMGWYWAIITMTTVGYGDISPKTTLGHCIATVCAISGVLLLAITLPMFVNNFLCLYQYSCVNESIEKNKEKRDKRCSSQPLKEKTFSKSLENVNVESESKTIFVKTVEQ